jgi:hypothetical protein
MWPFTKKWDKYGGPVDLIEIMLHLYLLEPQTAPDLRDRDYQDLPFDRFLELAWDSRKTWNTYEKERFDCDDFADCAVADIKRGWARVGNVPRALAFGYISADSPAGHHAFLWHYSKGIIRFAEPQTTTEILWKPKNVWRIRG